MADKINPNSIDAHTKLPLQANPTTGDTFPGQRGNVNFYSTFEGLKAALVTDPATTDGSIQEFIEGTTAGETTFSFTATTPTSSDNVFIYIDGRLRRDFTLVGQDVTFDEPPETGETYVLVHWQTVGGGGGGGGVTDHGALTGLTDAADHPGYLTLDGTRPMTGNLDAGGNSVTNVSLVDGRDPSVDGTKLDTIATGAEVNPVQVDAGEKTAGTETAERSFSPDDVKDMVVAHAPGGGDMLAATYDPGTVAGDAFDMDNMADGVNKLAMLAAERSKLSGVELLADVTDAANVDAAGAVMNSDGTTAAMSFVVDEDNMSSDSPTKLATQQSIKAYVDATAGGGSLNNIIEDTTPQLGGALDVLSQQITTSVVNGDVVLAPNGTGAISVPAGTYEASVTADDDIPNKKYVDDAIISGSGYGDENAQDAIGSILTDTATIDFTYDDGTPQITASVKAASVSNSLIANMTQSTIKGRATAAGTGSPQDLTAAQVRTLINVADGANAYSHPNHTGDVTSAGDAAQTIVANAVTNAKAADMSQNTIKGRTSAGLGDPEDLTATQVRTIINVADGADVTDAANVNSAGAVMNADVSTASMSFVIDEDSMGSDTDTKVPTQQSVKAYIDSVATLDGDKGDITISSGVWTIDLGAVTFAKMQDISENVLLGRADSAGTGSPTVITLGTNISLSAGGVLNVSAGTATLGDGDYGDITVSGSGTAMAIDADVVTNAKAANMAESTIKGRVTAGTGDPEDLTASQVRTILNVVDGANNYSHPNHTGDVTSVGDGAQTIAANVVSNTKLADVATSTVKGRVTGGSGDPEDLTPAQLGTVVQKSDMISAFPQLSAANLDSDNDLVVVQDVSAAAAAQLSYMTPTDFFDAGSY